MSTAPDPPTWPRRTLRPSAERTRTDRAPVVRDRGDACPGALRLHRADDGPLARIRVPGGVLSAAGGEALGEAAGRFGDGDLHLTSRGNVQLRGLDAGCGAELAELLSAAGLLPSAAHERIRNIVASPLSGLDGRGHLDVGTWLRALDGLLCGSAAAAGLSGRFLFALDDGRGDVAALAPDVTIAAAPDGGALLRVGRDRALPVSVADAPRAALLAAEAFLNAAAPDGGEPTAWRVADLPDGGAALTDTLAGRLPSPAAPAPPAPSPSRHGTRAQIPPSVLPPGTRGEAAPPLSPVLLPPLGPVPHPDAPGDLVALSVLAPLGRLTPAQWHALTALAARTRAAELRLTPWRGAVVPGVPADRARAELAALAAVGLAVDEASPWAGVSACAGRPGCAKSLADVRADAAALVHQAPPHQTRVHPAPGHGEFQEAVAHRAPAGEGPLPAAHRPAPTTAPAPVSAPTTAAPPPVSVPPVPAARPLPLHWSGCSRGCGRPRADDRVEVVATADGYRVSLFRAGAPAGTARPRPRDLAATLAAARRGAPIE